MTDQQLIRNLLQQEWTPTISGRSDDVPEPKFSLENDDLQETLRTRDVCTIDDGGDTEITPMGLGFTHNEVEGRTAINLRSADRTINGERVDGRQRMFGVQTGIQPSDRHGGLAGEAVRIILKYRKSGVGNYDMLVPTPVRNISGQTGVGHYRAEITVLLIQTAEPIDTSV